MITEGLRLQMRGLIGVVIACIACVMYLTWPVAAKLDGATWSTFAPSLLLVLALFAAILALQRIGRSPAVQVATIEAFEARLAAAEKDPAELDDFVPPPELENVVATIQRVLRDLHDKRRQAEASANYLIATQNRLELLLQETRDYAASRELYEASFEVGPVGIVVLDENAQIIDINPMLSLMSGYRREALIGREIAVLIHPDDRQEIEALIGTLHAPTAEPLRATFRGRTNEGISYHIDASAQSVRRGPDRSSNIVLFFNDVSEQVWAEEEVREVVARQQSLIEEQRLFRYVFDSNLVGISITVPDQVAHKHNARFAEIAGYPLPEIARMQWLDIVHPDDRSVAGEAYHRALSGVANEFKLHVRFVRQDETVVEVHAQGRAQHGQSGALEWFALLVEDETARQRAERERAKALESLKYLLANIPDGVIDVDPQGHILSANPAISKMFGFPERELVGMSIDRLIPSFHFDNAPSFRMFAGDTKGRRSDGSSFDVGYNYKQRVFEGQEIYTLIVYDNSMVKQLISQLETARDAALASARVKATFLATMSHELRTPLNGVLGMLDLLLGTDPSREQKDYIKTASRSGAHLRTLIDNILDHSKLEAQQMMLEAAPYSPRLVAEEVAELIAAEARDKQVDVCLVVDCRLPEHVLGDAGRMRQVLINLMGNAVKFTLEGEILLDVRSVTRKGQAMLRVEVKDTGIGIPEDALERIFESFVQAEVATARRFGGSGLGLSICRQLVDLMGGRLQVSSEPGVGSRFHFEIPLQPCADARPPDLLKGREIIVIAQSKAVLASVRTALACSGAELHGASGHGRDLERCRLALRDAVDQGRSVALVLDFYPDPNFAQRVFESFRALDPGLAARSVGLVAFGRRPDHTHAQMLGVHALVQRPIHRAKLLKALGEIADVDFARWAELDVTLGGGAPVPAQAPILPAHPEVRVLAVDDVDVNLMVVAGLLRQRGVEVVTALGGEAALLAVARQRFDLILLDCQMPGVDGFEVLRTLRAQIDWRKHVPVVAMTAGDSSEERALCQAAGMDEVLAKPVDGDDLDRLVGMMLGVQPGRGARLDASISPDADADADAGSEAAYQASVSGDASISADALDIAKVNELKRLLPAEALAELHRTFKAESEIKLKRLEDALTEADRTVILEIVHAFKGSAYNVGAVRLGDFCRELELRLGPDGAAFDQAMLSQLARCVADSNAALPGAYGVPL